MHDDWAQLYRKQLLITRKALEFYAAGKHIDYSVGHPSGTYLRVEDGVVARNALEEALVLVETLCGFE